jgi:DMSO/TMAO reductase YedYZ heme-binding membrane subunit
MANIKNVGQSILRQQVSGHRVGQWAPVLLGWLPPVAVVVTGAAYAAGRITRTDAIDRMIGWNEVPGIYLWMAMLWCTPLTTLTGRNLSFQRKHFGLAFTVLAFSNLINFSLRRPASAFMQAFAILGVTAVTLVLPLAITSKRSVRRRIGARRWKRLHRLVYLITIVLIVHLWLVPTTDGRGGALSGTIILGTALVLRTPYLTRRLQRLRPKTTEKRLQSVRPL